MTLCHVGKAALTWASDLYRLNCGRTDAQVQVGMLTLHTDLTHMYTWRDFSGACVLMLKSDFDSEDWAETESALQRAFASYTCNSAVKRASARTHCIYMIMP